MKIVFLGTPEFAVPSLEAIIKAGYDLPLVVTQPDRPKGREGKPQPPPVKLLAQAHGIPVCQPESVNSEESVPRLAAEQPDVLAVAAFGQILRKRVIELPRIACVNVHASLLPKYRGAAPVPAAILNGERISGVTIQKVVRKLDAGDIIRQESIPIGDDETAGELAERLARLGGTLLIEALRDLEHGTARFVPQDDSLATSAPMLTKADGLIRWSQNAEQVARHVRAMTPWPGAFTFLARGAQPLRITIKRARPESRGNEQPGEPGVIVSVSRERFAVKAGCGVVLVEELQPAGKRQMSAAEFIRGYRITTGERFADG